MRTPAVVGALLAPTLRAARHGPTLIGAALGLGLIAVPAATGTDLDGSSWAGLLRFAAVTTALGVTFALDDPSRPSTAVLPVPWFLRNLLRVAVPVPVAVACWVAVAMIAGHQAAARASMTPLRLLGLTPEAATVFLLAVAVTAAAARFRPDGSVGVVAAPMFVAVIAALYALPDRVALFVATTDVHWEQTHEIWAVLLLVIAAAVLLLIGEHLPRPHRRFIRGGRRGVHRSATRRQQGAPVDARLDGRQTLTTERAGSADH